MENYQKLTRGSLLARNVLMNLVGWGAPALAALVALPFLVRGLGDARFGVLTLAWTALGYFSLFDLGIARALTHAVSDRLGRDSDDREIARIIWTSLVFLTPVGLVSAGAVIAAAPWLAQNVLEVPAALRQETATAFIVLAVAIPFTSATAALRGSLEAAQRFDAVNALRVPYGLLTFLGPLAVLPFSRSVVPAVAVLTAGRAALCLAHVVVCARMFPSITRVRGGVHPGQLRPLLRFGGWMTVSNVISPLMNTLDRFVVGAVLSVGAVTYYATPQELVTKMWLFTAALFPVLFPAFATSAGRDPAHTASLFDRSMRVTFGALLLPTLLLVALAPDVLRLWLGGEFAERSTSVMQVLAIAVFVNSLAQGALTLIHAMGRPDLSGKFHLMELPAYLLLLWFLLPRFGILGVAWTWAIRAVADAVLLLATCPVLLPESRDTIRRVAIWIGLAAPVLGLMMFLPTTGARAATAALAIPAWIAIVWWGILTTTERALPARLLGAQD